MTRKNPKREATVTRRPARRQRSQPSVDRLMNELLPLNELEEFEALLANGTWDTGQEFHALIEAEYRRLDGPTQDRDEQFRLRHVAAASVGYQLGLAVARRLTGGAR